MRWTARQASIPRVMRVLEKNDDANIDKVLNELETTPEDGRTARFRCVLAVAGPGIETETFSGSCEGLIHTERKERMVLVMIQFFIVPAKESDNGGIVSLKRKVRFRIGEQHLAKLKLNYHNYMTSVGDSE